MSSYRVVVDGSNLATEGRSTPSLAQLDEAVRDFMREFPGSEVTVVVDASFGHRIEEAERSVFEEAVTHGEVISPPAGAVGRGDAFLLRIAERTGAIVLSNDSFQEFHGDHQWLFSRGRLVGGKPVPGVGWIFTPRTPVRGVKSKQAIREARASEVRLGSAEASQPMPVPTTPPPSRRRKAGGAAARERDRSPQTPAPAAAAPVSLTPAAPVELRSAAVPTPDLAPLSGPDTAPVQRAIADATEEALTGGASPGRGRRRRRSAPPQAVNDPLTFIRFIAEHPLGARVEGEVERFTSHGAFVAVNGAHCYVPLSSLGNPMPRRARDLLSKGERRTFVLQALDPQRRGVELALPEFAHVSGEPKPETVDAEIAEASHPKTRAKPGAPEGATVATGPGAPAGEEPPAKKAKPRKGAAKTAAAETTAPGAKATKAARATKAPEAAKAAKATKVTKAAKATKATKAAKTTKVTKATKAAKATASSGPEGIGPEGSGTVEGEAGAVEAARDATATPAREHPVKKAAAKKAPVKKAATTGPGPESAPGRAAKAAGTTTKAAATKKRASKKASIGQTASD
jgi:hypothetical protein